MIGGGGIRTQALHRGFEVILFWLASLSWSTVTGADISEIAIRTRTGHTNATGDPIRIHTSLPLDCCSTFHNYGRSLRQNYETLIDWISETRGGVRVNGTVRPLEVVIYNDFSESAKVTELYEMMVSQGHRLFLSTYSSTLSRFAAAVINTSDAVMIAPGAASPSVFQGRPRVFGTFTPAPKYLEGPFSAPAKFAKTVIYVYEGVSFTTSMCSSMPQLANDANVTLAGGHEIAETPSREVVRAFLLTIKDSPPDVIVGCVYKQACRFFIQEIASLEIQFKAIVMSTCGNQDFNDVGRESAEYVIGLTPWTPEFKLTSQVTGRFNPDFAEQYVKKYAETPDYQGVSAQMALLLYVQAIEKTQSIDPADLVGVLPTLNMETIYGTVSFDANRQGINPLKGVQVSFTRVAGEELSVLNLVAPEAVAEVPLTYPMPSWIGRKCLSKDIFYPFGVDNSGACVECAAGSISEWSDATSKRQCVPCGIGNQTDFAYNAQTTETIAVCVPCALGHANGVVGAPKCNKCLSGRFANSTGRTECSDCTPGRAVEEIGKSECVVCGKGSYADSFGMSDCNACPAGRFADATGSTECEPCPLTMLTFTWSENLGEWLVAVGAKTRAACGCKVGYQPSGSDSCVECSIGLNCIGNGQVKVVPGYASDGKLSAFKCRPDPKQCPGGDKGICADGRRNTSVGCSMCEDDKTPAGDGTCGDCGAWGYVLVSIAIFLMVSVLLCVYTFNGSGDAFNTSPALMQVGITLGQMLVMIQNLGIVGLISIQWPLNLQNLFDVLKVFNFDISMLRPECLTSVGAVGKYLTRLLLIVVTLGVVMCMHVFSVLVFHKGAFAMRNFVLIGSCGSVVMMFFISVVTTILTPFQCDGNPNGVFTLRGYPEISCWKGGDHETMIGIGICATIVPIAFLVTTSFVIYRLPSRMAVGDTVYLRTWAFMLVRFRPGMYWMSPLLIFRNALFGLASVFTRALVQIVWLEAVLFISVVGTAYFLPWRVWQGNWSDGLITSVMLFIVALTAFFVDETELTGLSDMMMAAMIFLLAGVPVAVVLMLVKNCSKKKSQFQFFLCHHKLAAGASARLLKLMLTRQSRGTRKTFIDSDDLKNLSQLFDTVAYETETLAVLHTADVLKRPWCMGEITISYKRKVPTVIVMFPGCHLPSIDFIDNYETFVQGIHILTDYGINLTQVKEALKSLTTKPSIYLPEHITKKVMVNTCKHLVMGGMSQLDTGEEKAKTKNGGYADKGAQNAVAQSWTLQASVDTKTNEKRKGSRGRSASKSSSSSSLISLSLSGFSGSSGEEVGDGTVVIIADSQNWEAVSAALVLHEFMLVHLYQNQDKLPTVLRHGDFLGCNATDVVLICTSGMFHKAEVVEWLIQAATYGTTALPILADVGFKVPHGPSLQAGCDHVVQCSRSLGELQQLMVDIFLEIGIVFQCSDAAGTEETLKVKGKEVATRVCMSGRRHLKLTDKLDESTKYFTVSIQENSNNAEASEKSKNGAPTISCIDNPSPRSPDVIDIDEPYDGSVPDGLLNLLDELPFPDEPSSQEFPPRVVHSVRDSAG